MPINSKKAELASSLNIMLFLVVLVIIISMLVSSPSSLPSGCGQQPSEYSRVTEPIEKMESVQSTGQKVSYYSGPFVGDSYVGKASDVIRFTVNHVYENCSEVNAEMYAQAQPGLKYLIKKLKVENQSSVYEFTPLTPGTYIYSITFICLDKNDKLPNETHTYVHITFFDVASLYTMVIDLKKLSLTEEEIKITENSSQSIAKIQSSLSGIEEEIEGIKDSSGRRSIFSISRDFAMLVWFILTITPKTGKRTKNIINNLKPNTYKALVISSILLFLIFAIIDFIL